MAKRWGKVKTVIDFPSWAPKSLWMFNCSHELKRHLLHERKAIINLDSILKRRYIILPTKVHRVKAMVLPVVVSGCESWTTKTVFELWHWRGCLRVPWTARRSNQSIIKETNPDYTLKGLMLKLKLQNFGYLL